MKTRRKREKDEKRGLAAWMEGYKREGSSFYRGVLGLSVALGLPFSLDSPHPARLGHGWAKLVKWTGLGQAITNYK